MDKSKEMTEQEQQQWVRAQYQIATKYLAEKGMITESVIVEESRYLVPNVAIWKLNLINDAKVWVICGELPTDHANSDVSLNARDASRHFSLKWQLQAENLLKAGEHEQDSFAHSLISRAEGLYELFENEQLWQ